MHSFVAVYLCIYLALFIFTFSCRFFKIYFCMFMHLFVDVYASFVCLFIYYILYLCKLPWCLWNCLHRVVDAGLRAPRGHRWGVALATSAPTTATATTRVRARCDDATTVTAAGTTADTTQPTRRDVAATRFR